MAAAGAEFEVNAKALALLWEPRATPSRGPRPTLSLEAIARAGIEIADIGGLAAVTMQRVAAALDVTKMALYRYVPGKVELVALMVDMGVGEAPDLDAVPGGWRQRLHEWALRMFDRFWRHPWALEATVGTRAIGPNELGWLEQGVAALAGTGLGGAEMLDVAATLLGHVRGVAQQGTAMASGTPERAMVTTLAGLLRGREGRYPAVVAALDAAAEQGAQDKALDFGIARILDGVELLIAGVPDRTRPPARRVRRGTPRT
ncbi:MAG: TetR/AcrR family transcriptional regulator C-terminal domain-containing protein [Kutzneria sp.]|nr:TetR/AcrR family transcriptional regulator C-terminal domain-containing protein [Kutzneria sp.]MBV9844889.1 TetR/AcrR family transcriptional regulator C-terminal domain-containing protein [Kutzneria sp.]